MLSASGHSNRDPSPVDDAYTPLTSHDSRRSTPNSFSPSDSPRSASGREAVQSTSPVYSADGDQVVSDDGGHHPVDDQPVAEVSENQAMEQQVGQQEEEEAQKQEQEQQYFCRSDEEEIVQVPQQEQRELSRFEEVDGVDNVGTTNSSSRIESRMSDPVDQPANEGCSDDHPGADSIRRGSEHSSSEKDAAGGKKRHSKRGSHASTVGSHGTRNSRSKDDASERGATPTGPYPPGSAPTDDATASTAGTLDSAHKKKRRKNRNKKRRHSGSNDPLTGDPSPVSASLYTASSALSPIRTKRVLEARHNRPAWNSGNTGRYAKHNHQQGNGDEQGLSATHSPHSLRLPKDSTDEPQSAPELSFLPMIAPPTAPKVAATARGSGRPLPGESAVATARTREGRGHRQRRGDEAQPQIHPHGLHLDLVLAADDARREKKYNPDGWRAAMIRSMETEAAGRHKPRPPRKLKKLSPSRRRQAEDQLNFSPALSSGQFVGPDFQQQSTTIGSYALLLDPELVIGQNMAVLNTKISDKMKKRIDLMRAVAGIEDSFKALMYHEEQARLGIEEHAVRRSYYMKSVRDKRLLKTAQKEARQSFMNYVAEWYEGLVAEARGHFRYYMYIHRFMIHWSGSLVNNVRLVEKQARQSLYRVCRKSYFDIMAARIQRLMRVYIAKKYHRWLKKNKKVGGLQLLYACRQPHRRYKGLTFLMKQPRHLGLQLLKDNSPPYLKYVTLLWTAKTFHITYFEGQRSLLYNQEVAHRAKVISLQEISLGDIIHLQHVIREELNDAHRNRLQLWVRELRKKGDPTYGGASEPPIEPHPPARPPEGPPAHRVPQRRVSEELESKEQTVESSSVCDICRRTFGTAAALDRHISLAHRNSDSGTVGEGKQPSSSQYVETMDDSVDQLVMLNFEETSTRRLIKEMEAYTLEAVKAEYERLREFVRGSSSWVAACTIQRGLRVMRAKEITSTRRSEYNRQITQEELIDYNTFVRSVCHRWLMKCLTRTKRSQRNCRVRQFEHAEYLKYSAGNIQRIWRGYYDRKYTMVAIRTRFRLAQQRMAVRIQLCWKRWRARRYTAVLRKHRGYLYEEQERQELLNSSARILQANFRRYYSNNRAFLFALDALMI